MITAIIILSIFLLLAVALNIILYIEYRKSKENIIHLSANIKNLKDNMQYNFENDTSFLLYIVSYKCKVYDDLILKPGNIIYKDKLYKSNDLNSVVNDIVNDILGLISNDYKKVLYKYFSEDGLIKYIVEITYNNVISLIVNKNKKKIFKFNNIEEEVQKQKESQPKENINDIPD